MAEVLILEFTGVGEAEYDAVNSKLGMDMRTGAGDWPGGLLMHAAGTADDGAFLVTEVWSSRADQAAFMQGRLGAALAAGGITSPPRVRWAPLLSYQVAGT
jgi:hypothetical protein